MYFLIQGMHRSGTSLVANLLYSAGVSVGDLYDLDDASVENPRGFWESKRIRALNDELLGSIDCSWDRVLNWDLHSIPKAALDRFEISARKVLSGIDSQFAALIKDPRMSITFDAWSHFFQKAGHIWVVRSPIETAISLRTRNDFPIDFGLSLWEYYNLSISKNLLKDQHSFHVIDYQNLLQSPMSQMDDLKNWMVSSLKTEELEFDGSFDESLIDTGLYRSRESKKTVTEIALSREHPCHKLYAAILENDLDSLRGKRLSEESTHILARHESSFKNERYRTIQKAKELLIQNRQEVEVEIESHQQVDIVQKYISLTESNLNHAHISHQKVLAKVDDLKEQMNDWLLRDKHLEKGFLKFGKKFGISSLEIDYASALSAVKDTKEATRKTLPDDLLKAISKHIEKQNQEIENLKHQTEMLTGSNTTLEEQLTRADDDLNARQQEVENLKHQTEMLTGSNTILEEQLMRADDDLNARQQEVENLKHLTEVLTGSTLTLEKQLTRAVDDLDARQQDVENLQQQTDLLAGSNTTLEEQLTRTVNDLDARQQEVKNLKQQTSLLAGSNTTLEEQLTRAEDDLFAKQKDIAVFGMRLDSARSQYSNLLNQLDATEKSLISNNSTILTQNEVLSATLQQIRDALSAMKQSWRFRIGHIIVNVYDRVRLKYPQELASDFIENIINDVLNSPNPSLTAGNPGTHNRDLSCFTTNPKWLSAKNVLDSLYPRIYEIWEQENNEHNCNFKDLVAKWDSASPRVMVGTLYSGENEFESSTSAITRQSYRNLTHQVIKGLPNKEAHDQLYGDFLSSNCDYLVKIDADMVIVDESFIEKVVKVLVSRPGLAMLQMAILDYYSGGEIQGVNAYTKRMRWDSSSQHSLFTDSTQTPSAERWVVWGTFTRHVIHSPNPGLFQAFHFGVHRAMKVLRALEEEDESRAAEQMLYLERTYQHFKLRKVKNLLVACLGAELAFREGFSDEDLDYTSNTLKDVFSEYEVMPQFELTQLLIRLRNSSVKNSAIQSLRNRRRAIAKRSKVSSVLFLLPHFRRFGGVNRFFEIATHLKDQGVEAVIAAPNLQFEQVKRVNFEFSTVSVCSFEEALDRTWDIVICGDFSSTIMMLLPWFDSAVTAVYLLNGWQHRVLNNKQIEFVKPDLVLANSSYAALQYPEWAPAVVAGAVDCEMFHPLATSQINPGQPIKVYVPGGRNKPRKRFMDAVSACEIAFNNGVDVQLHVLDTGSLDISVPFELISHSKLSRKNVAELLQSMDIALCPEEDAGWNNPAAEAMASGVPLICTEAGTTDFAFNQITAIVVPARSPQLMADALQMLNSDIGLRTRLAEEGRKTIETFTWPVLTRKLIDLVESCRFDRTSRQLRNERAIKTIKYLVEAN